MVTVTCAICDKNNPYTVLYPENFNVERLDESIFSARRLPDRVHYRIVRCNGCGLIFSNPILELEKIEKLYKQSKMTYEEELEDLKETYGYYLKKFEKFFPSTENLLEIGCGNGFFLERALKLGFKNVYGVEPSKDAVNRAAVPAIKDKIVVDILKNGLFKHEFFDVICAFQVFDHISNPNEFLKICFNYLKKDGILFFINHNVSALPARILKSRCPIIDVEHIYLYDKNTQKRILEKNNFKVAEVFDVFNIYPIKYWLRMLPLPNVIQNFFLRLLKEIKIADKKFKLMAGNMGIVAQKQ